MPARKPKTIAGDIGSLGFTDLIQLMGMTGRTATLILERGGIRGRIFFDKGNVLHAEAGGLEGRKAFTELLGWTDAEWSAKGHGLREHVQPDALDAHPAGRGQQ